MTKRLKSIFFVLILCGSVFSGTSFADNTVKKDSCPMNCCKKKAESVKMPQEDAANLCRTINCTNPAPISTTNSSQTSFAPLLFVLKNITIFQFLLVPQTKDDTQILFTRTAERIKVQPKYIQHQSFLI